MNKPNPNIWDIDNLPNRITLFRIILVPVIVGLLSLQLVQTPFIASLHYELGLISCLVFTIAAITDYIDGHLARKRNLVTVFGSFLDPIADKFLVVTSLILLQALGRIHPLVVVILVLREFYITSLRLLAADHGLNIPVGELGKWKTATQLVAIPILMIGESEGQYLFYLGTVLIYLAAIFSLYSSIQYSLALIKKLKDKFRANKDSISKNHLQKST